MDQAPPRVQLITSDVRQRAVLAGALLEAGFGVLSGPSLEQADLVVVDGALPPSELAAACAQAHAASLPVLMLATSTEAAREGIAAGADEYAIIPCSRQELELRARLALRHARARAPIVAGDLRIDPARHEATLAGRPLALTPTEFRLLSCLASNAGHVVGWQALLREAWQVEGSQGGRQMVKTSIYRLRRKVQRAAPAAVRILTIRGAGYLLAAGSAPPRPPTCR